MEVDSVFVALHMKFDGRRGGVVVDEFMPGSPGLVCSISCKHMLKLV